MSDSHVYDFLAQLEQDDRLQGSVPYKGAEIHRLNKSWIPNAYSADGAVKEGWDLLTRRILDLQRNDPAMIALRRTLVDHTIGTGIVTTANVMVAGDLDEEFNAQADEEFDWWAENEADYAGKLSFGDQQRQAMEEIIDKGEVMLLRCTDANPSRSVPLCYQVLEAEQLDESKDWPAAPGKNKCVRGIEVDDAGRPVAYHLFDAHPSDPYVASAYSSTPIPADRVIHVIAPGRPNQTRSISLHSALTQTARDLDFYLGTELTSASLGSLFTLVHKTKFPTSGFGFVGDGSDSTPTEDAYGNPKVKLGRGIVCQIAPEDEIESFDNKRPNSDARPFIDLILLLLSMGGNVSPYRLTRDYRSTTYVAARAARLDDSAAFAPLQRYIGRTICLPIRRAWTAQAVAYGLINAVPPSVYRRARRRWDRVLIQPPGVPQIDPEKETDADIAAIAAGLATMESVCSRRGLNWRRVILQRKREIEYAARHEVPLNYDRPSTPAKRASDEGIGDRGQGTEKR